MTRKPKANFTDYLYWFEDHFTDIMGLECNIQWLVNEEEIISREDLLEMWKDHKENNTSIKDQAHQVYEKHFGNN